MVIDLFVFLHNRKSDSESPYLAMLAASLRGSYVDCVITFIVWALNKPLKRA